MRKQAYPKTFLKISGLSFHCMNASIFYEMILYSVHEIIQPCSTFILVIEESLHPTNYILLINKSVTWNGHLQNFSFRSTLRSSLFKNVLAIDAYPDKPFTQSCLNEKYHLYIAISLLGHRYDRNFTN